MLVFIRLLCYIKFMLILEKVLLLREIIISIISYMGTIFTLRYIEVNVSSKFRLYHILGHIV